MDRLRLEGVEATLLTSTIGRKTYVLRTTEALYGPAQMPLLEHAYRILRRHLAKSPGVNVTAAPPPGPVVARVGVLLDVPG